MKVDGNTEVFVAWKSRRFGISWIAGIPTVSRKREMERKPWSMKSRESMRFYKNCFAIDHCIGGIFIDGKLEAFSIGAYNPREEMAVISIEKANPNVPGIYQVINQEFLIHEFPKAKIVNREDDMGLQGLRRAKESYNPIGFARKYMVLQKDFQGYEKYLTDKYEGRSQKTMSRRILLLQTEAEQERTKALYREIFPEDSEAFVDYYYQKKTEENPCHGGRGRDCGDAPYQPLPDVLL